MFPFAVDLAGSPILPLCYSSGDILLSRVAGRERHAAHAKQGQGRNRVVSCGEAIQLRSLSDNALNSLELEFVNF